MEDIPNFYKHAARYWAGVPPTVDGVLGGYGHISDTDVQGSKDFLESLFHLEQPPSTKRALDCGAGIGRITKHVLSPKFRKIDLIDQDAKFIQKAKELLKDDWDKIGDVHVAGLQAFQPKRKYDLIWCQWVLGHLTDQDLVQFLERCKESLSRNGVIVAKENITADPQLMFDKVDSSITRPYKPMVRIFMEAGLKIVKESVQSNFPSEIFPVYMFALAPNTSTDND